MSVTINAPAPIKTTPFPLEAIVDKLRDEMIEAAKIEASLRGLSLPATPDQIAKVPLHLDSLVAVAILCTVEPIIGFELPESVVRTGGYISVEHALTSLLPRLEKEWAKKKGTMS